MNLPPAVPHAASRGRAMKALEQWWSGARWCSCQICAIGERFASVAKNAGERGRTSTHTERPHRLDSAAGRGISVRGQAMARFRRLVHQHVGLAWKMDLIRRLAGPRHVGRRKRQRSQNQQTNSGDVTPRAARGRCWASPVSISNRSPQSRARSGRGRSQSQALRCKPRYRATRC
jgi:hypothetical protein